MTWNEAVKCETKFVISLERVSPPIHIHLQAEPVVKNLKLFSPPLSRPFWHAKGQQNVWKIFDGKQCKIRNPDCKFLNVLQHLLFHIFHWKTQWKIHVFLTMFPLQIAVKKSKYDSDILHTRWRWKMQNNCPNIFSAIDKEKTARFCFKFFSEKSQTSLKIILGKQRKTLWRKAAKNTTCNI